MNVGERRAEGREITHDERRNDSGQGTEGQDTEREGGRGDREEGIGKRSADEGERGEERGRGDEE